MIDKQQRELLCALVDEMRIRGVTVLHLENDGLKLQVHMNSTTVEGALSDEVKARLLADPKTPKIVREQLEAQQNEEDLTDLTGAG